MDKGLRPCGVESPCASLPGCLWPFPIDCRDGDTDQWGCFYTDNLSVRSWWWLRPVSRFALPNQTNHHHVWAVHARPTANGSTSNGLGWAPVPSWGSFGSKASHSAQSLQISGWRSRCPKGSHGWCCRLGLGRWKRGLSHHRPASLRCRLGWSSPFLLADHHRRKAFLRRRCRGFARVNRLGRPSQRSG